MPSQSEKAATFHALHRAGDTQEEGVEAVADVITDDDTPEDKYHGYCFYDSQDLEHALDNEGLLLAHGHVDRSEAEDAQHIAVAQAICEALRHEGIEVEWNGSKKRRINLPSFRWQRRTQAGPLNSAMRRGEGRLTRRQAKPYLRRVDRGQGPLLRKATPSRFS